MYVADKYAPEDMMIFIFFSALMNEWVNALLLMVSIVSWW